MQHAENFNSSLGFKMHRKVYPQFNLVNEKFGAWNMDLNLYQEIIGEKKSDENEIFIRFSSIKTNDIYLTWNIKRALKKSN